MFLDDAPPKPKPENLFPRNITDASVAQMQEYIVELKDEIVRVEKEIEKRGSVKAKAEAFFS